MWLQVFSLMCVLAGPITQSITICGAMMDIRFCFKLGHAFQMIPGLFMLAWLIYGLTLYTSTTDAMCAYQMTPGLSVTEAMQGWNARTVTWWFSVPTIIFNCLLLCCLVPVCIAGMTALKHGGDSEEEMTASDEDPEE